MTVYRNGVALEPLVATIVVAASDSLYPERADYHCDGVADNVEIQAAINALPAGGGRVVLLEGTFDISNDIDLVSNLKLSGQGDSTILQMADGVAGDHCLTGNAITNVEISDLLVDGDKAAQTGVQTQFGIYWTTVSHSIIIGVSVIDVGSSAALSGYGIYFNNCDHNVVTNCKLSGCKRENIVIFNGSDYNIFSNSITRDCDDRNVVIHDSSYNLITNIVSDNSGNDGINITGACIGNEISDCIIANSGAEGIYTEGGADAHIVNNVIYNSATYGISVTSPGASIIGNRVYDSGSQGVYVIAAECVISENRVINSTGQGIYAQTDRGIISGNYVIDGSTVAIIVRNSSYCVIQGNLCKDNNSAGIFLDSSYYCTISGNSLVNNGGAGGGGDNGIHIDGDSDYNLIIGNTFDKGANQDDGIRLFAGATGNILRDNQLVNGGNFNNINDVGTGTEIYAQHSDLFMDVLAVSATHVRSNEDLSAGIPITFTIDAQPDVPRTLSGHFDSNVNITAYTIVITGVDAKGHTITETLTEADGWDWETDNAFATITSIIMTARTGTGVGDTMDIGITDVLGLSNIFYATGDVYKIKKNNANAIVAGAQVSTTYYTYDMAVIGLAVGDDFTIWFRSNLNII